MAFSSGRKSRETFSEINITPLTDVFLVLLVVMFLIAPLLDEQSSLKINPPQTQSTKGQSEADKIKSIFIEINKEGSIAINGDVLVKESEANDVIYDKVYGKITELTNDAVNSPNKPKIKLKADDSSTHGRVVSVYDAVSQAKSQKRVGQLVLVTVQKKAN